MLLAPISVGAEHEDEIENTYTPITHPVISELQTGGQNGASEDLKSAQDNAVDNITKPATIKTSPYTTATVVISIVLALLYAVYEFRHDIRNRIELTRRYIAHWRASRE